MAFKIKYKPNMHSVLDRRHCHYQRTIRFSLNEKQTKTIDWYRGGGGRMGEGVVQDDTMSSWVHSIYTSKPVFLSSIPNCMSSARMSRVSREKSVVSQCNTTTIGIVWLVRRRTTVMLHTTTRCDTTRDIQHKH